MLTKCLCLASFLRMIERIELPEQFPHVFRYGRPLDVKDQRWAFRFSIVDPSTTFHRGRPRSLAMVLCAEVTEDGESRRFYSAQEAALECDFWKFYLATHYSVQKLSWSLGSRAAFESAYTTRHGVAPQERVASPELQQFISDNSEVWLHIGNFAQSTAWDPDQTLYEANKTMAEVERLREAGEPIPPSRTFEERHALLDWAKKWKHHCALLEEVRAYGEKKLLAEASMNADLLNKAARYAESWPRPSKPSFYFQRIFEKLADDRKKILALLEEIKATQVAVESFVAQLPVAEEELKREKLNIFLRPCNPNGATPTGSASGSVSPDVTTTDKSSPTLHSENKTS